MRRLFKKSRFSRWKRALLEPHILAWDDQDVEVIEPAGKNVLEHAIFLDGQCDKIKDAAFGSISENVEHLTAHERAYPPILKRTLSNAFVTSNQIYAREGKTTFISGGTKRGSASNFERIEEPTGLPSSFIGMHFFGHWLGDDCATRLLAAELGRPYSLPTRDWSDKQVYNRLFGQDDPSAQSRLFRRLTIYDDISQNPHKADRLRILRGKVSSVLPPSNAEIVYMRRGRTGVKRELLNEDALVELLIGLGATIIEPETDGDHLVRSCLGARIFVSVEGSQISHAIYTLREDGGLMVIQPPDRFYASHRDWSATLGIPFAFVVADQADEGFRVDIDDFRRTLDLLMKRLDTLQAV